MSTTALNNLWTYIKGLSLSYSDRKWLAEHLVEPEEIERAKERKSLTISTTSAELKALRLRTGWNAETIQLLF